MKHKTVVAIYDKLNALNFGGVLKRPVILFSRARAWDGTYNGWTMRFNMTDHKGLESATELVYHEMIHQYVDEILGLHDSTEDHGKEFRKQYNKFSFGIVMDKDYRYE